MANMFALILVIATLVTGLCGAWISLSLHQNVVNVRPLLRQRPAIAWTRKR
jgi:hypothetical protein